MSSHSRHSNESEGESVKSLLKKIAQDVQALSNRQLQHETLLKERDAQFALVQDEWKMVKERDDYTKSKKSSHASSSSHSRASSENESESPLEGDLLVVRRLLGQVSQPFDESQRENIFHTRCLIQNNICSLIVDAGSCANVASTRVVDKLGLPTDMIPIAHFE